ncbi:MAG: hypothetical protein KatS3mg108_1670 [Isosphaeraceae bacterium]|jgi:hypothetical protein|nr:MAG: hypothetical protein KatS3mg108_1670 [Isosphaeraceae bacterium]
MAERYWLILPNGGRQLIDPEVFDLPSVEERARRVGGRLVVELEDTAEASIRLVPAPPVFRRFEPPIPAVAELFRDRMARIHPCRVEYDLELNTRPTSRVLGTYYRSRRLIRVYTHDRDAGRRPLEELFDTFLHEMAHHLEYTEPGSFDGYRAERTRGRMHSRLFWQILRDLKRRWMVLQRLERRQTASVPPVQRTFFDVDA